MKWYSYIILTAVFSLFSVFSVNRYSDHSADLLRIAYLEKTALKEFSFDPFPLFVMLCSLMNIILAIVFITSNIPQRDLIISRFNSRKQYFVFIIKKQVRYTLICSATETAFPALYTILLCRFSNIFSIAAIYLLRQFVLLYLSAGISLILRRSLNAGAADIVGALLVSILIMVDVFANIPAALINLSGSNMISAGCEAGVCMIGTWGCFELFKKTKEI